MPVVDQNRPKTDSDYRPSSQGYNSPHGGYQGGYSSTNSNSYSGPVTMTKTVPRCRYVEIVKSRGETRIDIRPRLFMMDRAYRRMMAYIRECAIEVSGMGLARILENGDILIDEVLLLDQECTSAETELDTDALCELVETVDPGLIKVWWHSHVSMDVFWSGTDDECIRNLSGAGWMVSIVGNQRGEIKARIDSYSPLRIGIDDVEVTLIEAWDEEEQTSVRDELTNKVRRRSYATSHGGSSGGRSKSTGGSQEKTPVTSAGTGPSQPLPTQSEVAKERAGVGEGNPLPPFCQAWAGKPSHEIQTQVQVETSGDTHNSTPQKEAPAGGSSASSSTSSSPAEQDKPSEAEIEALMNKLRDMSVPEEDISALLALAHSECANFTEIRKLAFEIAIGETQTREEVFPLAKPE